MRAIFLADAHLKGPGDPAHPKLIRFFGRLRGRGITTADRYLPMRLLWIS